MQEVETIFSFYLVVPPGLEALALRELQCRFPSFREVEVQRGGLSFQAPYRQGLQIQKWLKIPTRLLLRVADFGCRDFPKLFKKIQKIPWEQWFESTDKLTFEVSTHGSRLKIKKRIAETCLAGWKRWQKERGSLGSSEGFERTVYVRFSDDVCTVSLDTTGERLHKRGIRLEAGEAPLRESLAAALLWSFDLESLKGGTLLDPMTGAGTFLLEGMSWGLPTTREFAFQTWREPKGVSVETDKASVQNPVWQNFVGFDLDADMVKLAQQNQKSLNLSAVEVAISEGDAFQLPGQKCRRPLLMVCNPPYGLRLPLPESPFVYYGRLLTSWEESLQPDFVGLLIPARVRRLQYPTTWTSLPSIEFQNGGVPVRFWRWQRKTGHV